MCFCIYRSYTSILSFLRTWWSTRDHSQILVESLVFYAVCWVLFFVCWSFFLLAVALSVYFLLMSLNAQLVSYASLWFALICLEFLVAFVYVLLALIWFYYFGFVVISYCLSAANNNNAYINR